MFWFPLCFVYFPTVSLTAAVLTILGKKEFPAQWNLSRKLFGFRLRIQHQQKCQGSCRSSRLFLTGVAGQQLAGKSVMPWIC